MAWLVYQKQVISAQAIKERFNNIYTLLYNKYYIDEIYAWLIKIFVDGTAKVFFWFDIYVVNGLVNGLAILAGNTGKLLRYTENGQVQTYAVYMIAGVIVMLAAVLLCGVAILL